MMPVPLSEQVREIEGQLAKHRNMSAKWVSQRRMSDTYAAAELQRLQSALDSLKALERLLGPGACLTADQMCDRLSVRAAA